MLTLAAGITFPFASVIFVFAPAGLMNFGNEAVIVVALEIVVEVLLGTLLAVGVATG